MSPHHVIVLTLLLAGAFAGGACSDEKGGSGNQGPSKETAEDADTRSVVDPTCPEDHGEREDTPAGSCAMGATCSFETTATCKAGVAFVPATPNQWECRCPDGTWACEIVSGGYGVVPCPDASTVDADVH